MLADKQKRNLKLADGTAAKRPVVGYVSLEDHALRLLKTAEC